jgi:hypothetical protein
MPIRRRECRAAPENTLRKSRDLNGREVVDELSLDTHGFVLTLHETAVRDFYDSEEVTAFTIPKSSAC